MTGEAGSEAAEAPKPVALASYELLGKLARGGMGTVYVARRAGAAGFQRLFAVKLMHDHLADHEEFVQMFLDEARLAARLHHPNVVAILDTGEIEGRQFVVMDYVEGCSLQQLLKLSPDNRPVRSIVSIFNDFLLGLHAAHELRGDDGNPLNLVHRDVSPQNILIGVDGVARITDFGIAKAEARLTSTRPGLRKGKLAFMAPEQLYDEEIDRRVDIFSAGAMLWSTLTGEKLFAGSSDAATMRNLLQMEIQPPSEVGLKPPPYFDEICLKALAKKPEDRHQSAAEFADVLRAAAMEHNVFGSSADVATWMSSVAGNKLDDRRRALGSATSDSAVHSMPVLVESPVTSTTNAGSVTNATRMRRRVRKPLGMMGLTMILVPLAAVFAVVMAVLTTRRAEPLEEGAAANPGPAPSEPAATTAGRDGTAVVAPSAAQPEVFAEDLPPETNAPSEEVPAEETSVAGAPPVGAVGASGSAVPAWRNRFRGARRGVSATGRPRRPTDGTASAMNGTAAPTGEVPADVAAEPAPPPTMAATAPAAVQVEENPYAGF